MFIRVARMRIVVFYLLVGALVGIGAVVVYAQGTEHPTLASPILIDGEARNGDLISFDAALSKYRTSVVPEDGNLYGVVVDDPVLYLEANKLEPGMRPVVRYGEAVINASTLNGPIKQGDLVTSSRISGVGARADRDHAEYIFGFATESMVIDDIRFAPMMVNGTEVHFGTVSVALRIGTNPSKVQDTEMTSTSTGIGAGDGIGNATKVQQEGSKPVDPFKVFRYILGTVVAITAVVLALRRFGDLFAQSVISVGRNPLARSQIRSILVWNAVLIIAVSSVGLGLGVAIIMLP